MAGWTDGTCEKLRIRTIRELGTWKFFLWAEAISELAGREIEGHRPEGSGININFGLDKAHENKSLSQVVQLPPSALQGIAEHSDEDLAAFHVRTIGDLGSWKYAKWAAAIVTLAELESEDIAQHK